MDDPDMGFWSYEYDALGGMTRQQDAKNQVTCLYYDNLNRPTGKDYFTNGATCPSDPGSGYAVTYSYDQGTNGIGRRTSMGVTGGDFTSWNYDIRGRVTSENKQIPGGGQFTTSFTYNTADLPVTMTYPVDNEVVTFGYNNNMLPVSVTGTDSYAQSIAYDSAMRMIQLVRGANKLNTVFNYNDWDVDGGRLLNLTTTRPSDQATLQNSTYDYDSVGNIQTITDSLLGPQTQTFQYDELDRLTDSNVTGGTNGLYSEGYTYETATGNLKTKGGGTPNTYTYDSTHKHAVASLSNGNTYGYDDNGNMTSRHILDGMVFKDFTLNYDAENRLVSVTGAATAAFDYDADGKQVKATVNGVTTVYVGNHYEVKNSVVTKYYFAGTTRLAVRTNGTLSYLLGDHLGSSSVTTDANGAKTASALYKAFGETRFTLGNLGTDYKFTGQREEASLGIYFFNARWFDPSLGRFTSPDTIVPTETQGTQAWDRYAFVNNNPVRYNDPTGHMVCQEDQIASGGKCVNEGNGNKHGYGSGPTINCSGPIKMDDCAPQPPTSAGGGGNSNTSGDLLDDVAHQKDDNATKEPELTSPEPEVDMAEMVAGAALVILVEVIAIALAAVVGFTSSATGPLAILAAYKTFELVNAVLAPIAFIGIGMMIHAAVKDDL